MFEFPNDFIIYVNGLLILLLIFVVYRGYKRGLLLQLVDLISTFVSLIIAWIFSDVFVSVFTFIKYDGSGVLGIDEFVSAHANRLIWFVILFIVIRLLMMLLTPLAKAISKVPLIKQVNSAVGGVFSIVTFVIYILIISFFLTLPIVKNGTDIINNTYLKPIHEYLHPVIAILDERVNENASIQSLLRESKLSVNQKQEIVSWLAKNGFSNDEIKEFLANYE